MRPRRELTPAQIKSLRDPKERRKLAVEANTLFGEAGYIGSSLEQGRMTLSKCGRKPAHKNAE